LCIVVDGNMVPRTLLQTRCYAPAAGSVLTSCEGLLHPVKRFEALLHPVKARIGQMRGLVTPGQAPATSRQSRSLDTLATTDNGQVASIVATQPFDEMPQPKNKLPILGHLPMLLNKKNSLRMGEFHAELKRELGPIYRMETPAETMVWLHDPEDTRALLAGDGAMPNLFGFDTFIEVRQLKEFSHIFGQTTGLISQGEEWAKFRQAVQQDMMRPSSALYYISEIEEISLELVEKIVSMRDQSGSATINQVCQEFALESIGCIFLGSRLGTLAGHEDGRRLIEAQTQVLGWSLPMLFLPLKACRWIPGWKNVMKQMITSLEITNRKVTEALEKVDVDDPNDNTVLAKFVRRCGKDSMVPTIMAIDALGAGIDTTGVTGALLLYHLAKNPDKQEILYKEIKEHVGPDGSVSLKALSKLKYLQACQKESQRILPVVFGTGRLTQVDLILGGYHVPKGTKVLRAGISTSMSEEQFSNPKSFEPERWLRNHPRHNSADPFANLPFGHGPRSCVGQRFAKLELYLMAAKVVQRFKMEHFGEEVNLNTGFLNSPDKDITIKFTPR